MDLAIIGIVISVCAFALSLWTRWDGVVLSRRQRKIARARSAGQALVAAQELKNQLSDCIVDLESHLKKLDTPRTQGGMFTKVGTQDAFSKIKTEYEQVWEFVEALEMIVIAFERGDEPPLDESQLEAKISHFHQRRVLAEFDVRFVHKLVEDTRVNTPSLSNDT